MEEKTKKLKHYFNLNFKKIYDLKFQKYDLYVLFFELLNENTNDLARYIHLLYIAYYVNCSEEVSLEQFFHFLNNYSLNEIIITYLEIYEIKKENDFRKKFYRKSNKKIKVPEFKLEDVEDYYTYYCLILGLSEKLFWNAELSFMLSVSANKNAYDSFISFEKLKLTEDRR